jgi:UDP-N-acetyl-D-mannosaminuronate dehydrogenase
MKTTIFEMGYVGCMAAPCLADHGHNVTGVDLDGNESLVVRRAQSSNLPGSYHQKRVNAGRVRVTPDTVELGAACLIRLACRL